VFLICQQLMARYKIGSVLAAPPPAPMLANGEADAPEAAAPEQRDTMNGPTCDQRATDLIRDLRTMIAASHIAGDREMGSERRHAAAAFRDAVNDALERAAALVERAPAPADAAALTGAIRSLKEPPP